MRRDDRPAWSWPATLPLRLRRSVQPRFALIAFGVIALLLLLVGLYTAATMSRTDRDQAGGSPFHAPERFGPSLTLDSAGALFMAWSPGGEAGRRVLATAQGNSLELWDADTGTLLHMPDAFAVSGLWWSPDGRLLAVGDSGNSVRVFDARTWQELHPRPPDRPASPDQDAVWSPDGRLLASRFIDQPQALPPHSTPMPALPIPGNATLRYGAIRLWDPITGSTVRVLRVPGESPQGQDTGSPPVLRVAWSSDGRYLAAVSGQRYRQVNVWDPASGTLLRSFRFDFTPMQDPDRSLPDLEWKPGGHVLAVTGGGIVVLWDADTGTELFTLPDVPPPPPEMPTAVPTVPGPLQSTPPAPPPVPTDAQGRPFTPPPLPTQPSPTPTPTYVYKGQHYGTVGGVAWSPDGRLLASFDGPFVRLWDPATGRQVQRMQADSTVLKIAWSPDGSTLASLDGEPSHSPPSRAPSFADPYTGGQPTYFFYDGTLRLWDPATGHTLQTILPEQVSDFEWSPDGHSIAVRTGISVTVWNASGSFASATVPATVPASQTPGSAHEGQITPLLACAAWVVAPLPTTTAPVVQSDLRAISMLSPHEGWAVGYATTSKSDPTTHQIRDAKALILRWDGRQWEQVPVPATGDGDSALSGVAAISGSDAWAVGYYTVPGLERRALTLHWDGTSWGVVPVPGLENVDASLNAVSAANSRDVWAVGTIGGRYTLALHWDGTRWTRTPTPSPGINLNELTAVYARADGTAWAAGRYIYMAMQAGLPQGSSLILRWDGTRWKPVPVEFRGNLISAIAVGPNGDGWVVGDAVGEGTSMGALTHLQGDKGQALPFPQLSGPGITDQSSPIPEVYISGLAAPAPDDVWVVGHFSTIEPSGLRQHTLALHWDGAVWSRVLSPDTGVGGSAFNAVASVAGQVWVVGHSGPPDAPRAFIMHLDTSGCATPRPDSTARPSSASPQGSLTPSASSVQATPSGPRQAGCHPVWSMLADDEGGPLNAVAAVPGVSGDGAAWAVGKTNGIPSRTLVKKWDGSRWIQVPSPSFGPYDNVLYGVAAVAPDHVWAVGAYYPEGRADGKSRPLILHIDGSAWTLVPCRLCPAKAMALCTL